MKFGFLSIAITHSIYIKSIKINWLEFFCSYFHHQKTKLCLIQLKSFIGNWKIFEKKRWKKKFPQRKKKKKSKSEGKSLIDFFTISLFSLSRSSQAHLLSHPCFSVNCWRLNLLMQKDKSFIHWVHWRWNS